ncbi:hypothetical protein BAUCODRAFT_411584 [Baudoinia panamericana UAMH 10762]|uniref:Thioredoxin domain-containing protein n=1 Tax=Baudoinia panamericana (strain UAMH 10762) TaxID=717646 RepID=M2N2B4_BAUPA|nr:uncharacterized protein BAUCODRAFT_411584 [Baudoinia panamericana UAMH 10762]EMC98053.1 hypothetical protein BAUCODRAFT_411584 [Baudoinia panamericana UAMH 10762]
MDIELYVYDLTHGMARQFSRQMLGISIDAVFHTSLVFGGIEYFFGAGVQTSYAGSTHHGQPIEKIHMGTTQLPMEVILDYLESLKQIYTPESYDLFAHNCNNFTNDFSMFLVGRGIPDHITGLPKRVLETPFGQMLKSQIDASMRSVTQAPVPPQNIPTAMNGRMGQPVAINGQPQPTAGRHGKVMHVTQASALDKHIASSTRPAVVVFFTSSTCAPCKLAYPTFDQLAEQHANAQFVKVDINEAREIGSRYSIRATPTFMTFYKGTKQDEWTGADPSLLKANVERLILQAYPPHPHSHLKVPTLQFGSLKSVTYGKVPPMDKLMVKLGDAAKYPEIVALRSFVERRTADPREATLPNLQSTSQTFATKVLSLPVEVRFAAVDLLRCAMIDPRVTGFLAEDHGSSTVQTLVKHVIELPDCPHNLRLVTIHLACNLFTSHLYVGQILRPDESSLASLLIQLVNAALLDFSHPTTRVAASWLAFNLAAGNYRSRLEESRDGLAEELQVEIAASLLEALPREDSEEAVKAQLSALGYLVYFAPVDGEVMDLCRALDAKTVVQSLKKHVDLGKEVTSLLD